MLGLAYRVRELEPRSAKTACSPYVFEQRAKSAAGFIFGIENSIVPASPSFAKMANPIYTKRTDSMLPKETSCLDEEVIDHLVWREQNRSNFEFSVIARLKGPRVSNVQYMVRLKNPQQDTMSYMVTLEGFKTLGELFLALHDFCKDPIFANERNVEKLKKLLTPENIKNFAELSQLRSGKTEKTW